MLNKWRKALTSTHNSPGIFAQCGLTPQQFLAGYWQKKPLLIPQAFPAFNPLLDADDIAGLACEELAESRLITGSYPEHDWKIRYGPFSERDFSRLPENNWTLLVQDVEKHYPPLSGLMRAFDFIPRWRIDDLMVSVAGPGGSVGPHVDQYDVFLLQAAGSRTWQIAEHFNEALLPDCDLNVLQSFESEQEWALNAGDMLYLPPGIAHHGTAVGPGMTWSIGMRAPSAADLYQAFSEWAAEQPDDGGRYRDPDLAVTERDGEISAQALTQLREFFQSSGTANPAFVTFLGEFLSSYRLAHQPAPPDITYSPDRLASALRRDAVLRQNPWSRLLWLQDIDGALLFAAGSSFCCSVSLAESICDPQRLGKLGPGLERSESELICKLLNLGHLFIEQL
ncbi:MAG: cupin domain-containing protein [Xanthomonadales bacterium]|nr:cupin domain-containing protein [Xanthomonadales bacterium]MDH3999913.1 cupin domain-containing protein [Xanthomonadales bacterium]